jgi:hypothetical protein
VALQALNGRDAEQGVQQATVAQLDLR